jgi:hypothetical protein
VIKMPYGFHLPVHTKTTAKCFLPRMLPLPTPSNHLAHNIPVPMFHPLAYSFAAHTQASRSTLVAIARFHVVHPTPYSAYPLAPLHASNRHVVDATIHASTSPTFNTCSDCHVVHPKKGVLDDHLAASCGYKSKVIHQAR